MNYQNRFKEYVSDLGAKKPAPGGGSAQALMFCLAVSLVEKSLRFSASGRRGFVRELRSLERLREKILPFTDLDAVLFARIFKTSGKERAAALKASEKIVIDTARGCFSVLGIIKKVEFFVKKGIMSDFILGKRTIGVVLEGCLLTLEGNKELFGSCSPYSETIKKALSDERVSGSR